MTNIKCAKKPFCLLPLGWHIPFYQDSDLEKVLLCVGEATNIISRLSSQCVNCMISNDYVEDRWKKVHNWLGTKCGSDKAANRATFNHNQSAFSFNIWFLCDKCICNCSTWKLCQFSRSYLILINAYMPCQALGSSFSHRHQGNIDRGSRDDMESYDLQGPYFSFCHHQQGRIDFNTANPSLPTGKDFLKKDWWSQNVRTPPKLWMYWTAGMTFGIIWSTGTIL